ncbi:LOW QUALITY PROTEIN: CAND2 isoform 6, partial [Pan troglodytes]
MGPFKHTVDDGLDVRKAAFECMYSLLESCLGQLDICEFLNHVEDGLKDHYDIRMLTFIMLARLATLCPAPVLQRVDRLIEPLRATCTAKEPNANSVAWNTQCEDTLLLGRRLPQHQSQHLPYAPAEAAGLCGRLQWLQDLLPPRLLHFCRGGAADWRGRRP